MLAFFWGNNRKIEVNKYQFGSDTVKNMLFVFQIFRNDSVSKPEKMSHCVPCSCLQLRFNCTPLSTVQRGPEKKRMRITHPLTYLLSKWRTIITMRVILHLPIGLFYFYLITFHYVWRLNYTVQLQFESKYA